MDFTVLKTTLFLAAIAAGPVAQAQTSVAGDRGAEASSRFDQLDRNRDGFLSRDEANGAEELNTRFSELDRNNDNKLAREEYEVLKSERSAASGASAKAQDRVKGAKGKTR